MYQTFDFHNFFHFPFSWIAIKLELVKGVSCFYGRKPSLSEVWESSMITWIRKTIFCFDFVLYESSTRSIWNFQFFCRLDGLTWEILPYCRRDKLTGIQRYITRLSSSVKGDSRSSTRLFLERFGAFRTLCVLYTTWGYGLFVIGKIQDFTCRYPAVTPFRLWEKGKNWPDEVMCAIQKHQFRILRIPTDRRRRVETTQ